MRTFNPVKLIDAYTYQWNKQALVQTMACRLFGTKLLSEPVLSYCYLDTWEQILVNLWTYKDFHTKKNCRLQNGVHFVSASMC